MNEIQITNFLGIESVTIPLGRVPVCVSGPNSSGKTSLSTAIGALLARTDDPLSVGAGRRPYLRDKTDAGEVVLRGEGGTEYLRWTLTEKGIRAQPDAPAAMSKHVLGLTNFTVIPPKYRVDVWESCFLPAPRELVEMVGAELEQQIGRGAAVDEVLKMLRTRPWPECEAVYSQKAKEGKREWQAHSGDNYGKKKADNWTPPGWRSELDSVTVSEARTTLENARERARMVQVGQAVADADASRAERARNELPNVEKELGALRDEQTAARAALAPIRAELQGIKDRGLALRSTLARHDDDQPRQEETTPCPGCGVALVVGPQRSVTLARDTAAFDAQLRAWTVGREKLEKDLVNLRAVSSELQSAKLRPADQREKAASAKVQDALARVSSLRREAQLAGRPVVTEEDQRHAAEAEQAVEDARTATAMVEKRLAAHNSHMNVVNYSAIAYALGPRGIRSRAMQSKMGELQAQLIAISQASGWPRVELDATYTPIMGGRPAAVSASNEKWRANFMLQAAIAMVLGEQHVIADGADILDSTCRVQFIGLVDWLVERSVYTITCATGGLEGIPSSWMSVQVLAGATV